MKKFVYADNAATTPLSETAFEAMKPWLTEYYGNPSSLYRIGRAAKEALNEARATVGKCLNAAMPVNEANDYAPGEIIFTAGGSQADNLAIRGFMHGPGAKGRKHIVTSKIEHHAVLYTCEALEKEGFRVTYLDVDKQGRVDLEQLKRELSEDTALVTIMAANNEIGTIQPIREIGEIARAHKILFHTDAVQAVGQLEIDLSRLPVDMLSLSAHKFHGPKGIGLLYVKKGAKVDIYLHGGGQESGKRAGTENTPGIVGLARALSLAVAEREEHCKRMAALRDRFIEQVEARIPYIRLNGSRDRRLPTNANFSFRFIEGESLLLMLDLKGIAASSGSACTSGSLDPSHVLLAIGLTHEVAHGSLRVTFGEDNTMEDVEAIVAALEEVVPKLRQMSPLYEEFEKGGKVDAVQ